MPGEESRRSAARLGEALPGRLPHDAGLPRACALLPVPVFPGDPAPAAAAAPAVPRLGPVSPQAGLARGVAAGLGTATSNTLPAARPRHPGSDQRLRSSRRTRTNAGRAGPEAAPATQRGTRIGRASSLFFVLSPLPVRLVCLFLSLQQVKDFNAVAESEQHFHRGAP